MKNGTDERPLVLAPVGITHMCSNIAQLVAAQARGRERIDVYAAAQPNSHPHLGSVTTLATAFSIAEELRDRLALPTRVVFDALENSPGEYKDTNGGRYQRCLADTPMATNQGARTKEEVFMASFQHLLGHLSAKTGVPLQIRPYREFGMHPAFRWSIGRMLRDIDGFGPIADPAEGRLHIRFPCPICRWSEKNCSSLKVESMTADELRLLMICPEHGPYSAVLSDSGGDLLDTGTSIREIGKAAVLAADGRPKNSLAVMVDGSDWSGNWALMVFIAGAHRLGLSIADLAERFFAPTIEDWSGGKFSKSVYVHGDEYEGVPDAYLNYETLIREVGIGAVDALLEETRLWARDPRRLLRNYSIEYIASVLKKAGVLPTA